MPNSSPLTVLAGDIGGTKTLLQIARFEGGQVRPSHILHEQRFESADFEQLETMVEPFLNDQGVDADSLHGACFGVAGPVSSTQQGERARLTNLPWQLDSHSLARNTGISRVKLINDFQAIGHGIETLTENELYTLHDVPATEGGPRVVLGAGTGLGVALLFPEGGQYRVWGTEAGHRDFAPTSEEQQALLRFLHDELNGHVSYERLLSGPGLVNIYRFVLHHHNHNVENDALLKQPDPAAAISSQFEQNPHARQALSLFLEIYAAEAGNLALTTLSTGGVYLAGGIAPKIKQRFKRERFNQQFCDKGRMKPILETIPVHIVTNPHIGLAGAALVASRL